MSQIVINAKERQQAFWKFLLLFILAVGLVLLAFYFDTLVPTKDNRVMRQQLNNFKLQEAAQDRFVQTMDETKVLIDSLRKPGSQKAYLNSLIMEKIRTLNNLQYKDSSMYSRLNTNVIDVFQRYLEATNKITDIGDMPTEVEKLKADNAQLSRDLTECRTQMNNLLTTPR
ncbi:type VI secretion system transmembrane protein TssO [Niabella pedocola]|uniref:Type VI secretion system transmembrane protein TssO n=1 Tax=Niabella pedocola TaxID=1752077 RepID=A0ABS8PR67_9BACT|nr:MULTISPECIES: type VI secretion system TssO [Niabella]MCD2423577.1 type VI secretion system transmembrane protein TssO [Niabella pedocola]